MSTIQVQDSTKQRLAKYGTLSSTYDSVINKILDHVETCLNFKNKKND